MKNSGHINKLKYLKKVWFSWKHKLSEEEVSSTWASLNYFEEDSLEVRNLKMTLRDGSKNLLKESVSVPKPAKKTQWETYWLTKKLFEADLETIWKIETF